MQFYKVSQRKEKMLTAVGWSKEVTLLEEPGKDHTKLHCGFSRYRGGAHLAEYGKIKAVSLSSTQLLAGIQPPQKETRL